MAENINGTLQDIAIDTVLLLVQLNLPLVLGDGEDLQDCNSVTPDPLSLLSFRVHATPLHRL